MENRDQIDPIGVLEGHAPHEMGISEGERNRKLVAQLHDRFTEAERSRNTWEADANFYLLYLSGEQLIVRNRTTNEVMRLQVGQDNPRLRLSIDNALRPAARACVGKLSRVLPTAVVLPRTDDSAEIRGAEVANSLLDYVSRKENLRLKYLKANAQLQWAGKAIFHLDWNKNAGLPMGWCGKCQYVGSAEEIGSPCPQCAMEAQSGAQPMEEGPQVLVEVREGDVEVDLLDPRSFYPEPGVDCIEHMRWCCVRKAVAVSKLRETYPDFALKIHAEGGLYSERTMGYWGNYSTTQANVDALQEHAYLFKFFEVPTALYPQGRVICMVNDMIVHEGPSPAHKLTRLPFYSFDWEPLEGEFWSECPISQAWPIQRERNQLLTSLRTQRDLTNTPRLLNPITSRINKSEFDNNPNRVIDYNPMGGAPKYLDVPSFPQYVYAELDRMKDSINEKFCITRQDLGEINAASSGRYAAIVESQASESIKPIVVRNGAEWIELHRGILIFCQTFYLPTRQWTVTGHDRVRSYFFDQMNLTPGYDVALDDEDSLSRNPALRLEQAIQLLQVGALNDDRTGMPDMRLFRRVAGLRVPGVGPDLIGSEHNYAAQIPAMLKQGIPFYPQPWDDARIMAEELLGWLRGEGRSENPQLVQQVGQIWGAYVSAIASAPVASDAQLLPPQSPRAAIPPPGGEQTGGPLNQGGQQPASGQAQGSGEARTADQMAEALANPGNHEG